MIDVWAEPSYERAAALGLDFMQAYVRGRAAALGDARPAVMAAAFAAMDPAMFTAVMEATAGVASDAIVEARTRGAVEGLERAFGTDVDDAEVDAAVETLRRGLDAADTVGRPLSAGLAAMAWPEHRLGRLWRATDLWREVRGDGHVAACVVAGLDGPQMNVLTELWIGWEPGRYSATRGWSPEALDAAAAALHDRGLVDRPGLDGVELTDHGQAFPGLDRGHHRRPHGTAGGGARRRRHPRRPPRRVVGPARRAGRLPPRPVQAGQRLGQIASLRHTPASLHTVRSLRSAKLGRRCTRSDRFALPNSGVAAHESDRFAPPHPGVAAHGQLRARASRRGGARPAGRGGSARRR